MVQETKVMRYFIIASLVWGVIAMTIGVALAAQLYWPELNFTSEHFQFGRLRPLHTNGVVFGLVCNILIGVSLYVVCTTSETKLISTKLAWILFYGWQILLVMGYITLPLGFTSTKEYAELEWPLDILMALLWLLYGYIFFATLATKKTNHIFVSNWFFGSVIIVITMIFVANNLALPVTLTKSYSIFSGASDALVQWWWGHNAVGFLLTASFIGINYYTIPKVTGQPIYSYRLSMINFWGIIGFYTWAGTHHMVYSSIPDWIQNIGIVMSLLLWLPSWAGAYNILRTVTADKKKLKENYILWFFLSAIIYYALSTAEGPLLAIRWFNAIAHNTNWIIGHVHSGALGWVGMSCIGAFYYMIPKLFGNKQLYSMQWVKYHFYLASAGVLFYIIALWIAGIGQGVMWQAQESTGALSYSFVDTLNFISPYMFLRFFGGLLYVSGMLLMAFNLYKTVTNKQLSTTTVEG
ncbi:cbb3-type cytochrome c oxidase subunit I [Vibrio sp. SS-MA-C1-2]|uniref:cbb3-type cytochrome c oxidase subunit I n=1 Tax=Vibrio sp. SS-MA-C1-2 TaxID=2908646 RepID=UPI001F31EB32|nr:cbb3-type cytochrome c oxidase subunit I [Vibrio sp. SS-MA-C1-2]UJF18207.1 cbb3-type cytochrome c oxidase subunit I [Vibrio sp. SS-MA-C1-2]